MLPNRTPKNGISTCLVYYDNINIYILQLLSAEASFLTHTTHICTYIYLYMYMYVVHICTCIQYIYMCIRIIPLGSHVLVPVLWFVCCCLSCLLPRMHLVFSCLLLYVSTAAAWATPTAYHHSDVLSCQYGFHFLCCALFPLVVDHFGRCLQRVAL